MESIPIHEVLYAVSLGICIFFFILTAINVTYLFIRSRKPAVSEELPFVTVLIPARNEEFNIRRCVESFLNQDYPQFEILVIDDNSTDKTPGILAELEAVHDNVRVFQGTQLPEGWYGKPWALQQLSKHAKGEYLIFADADTFHKEDSLTYMVSNMVYHKTDLLSLLPKQKISTFGELLIVPAIYTMTSVLMPQPAIELMKWKEAAYCLGQYFGVKADVYRKIDGFDSVKHLITEDVAFGKEVKKRGYKTMFLDGHNYLGCRMYHSYLESFKGIGKNIYSSIGHNLFLALFTVLLICIAVGYPLFMFIHSLITGISVGHFFIPVLVFLGLWVMVSKYHRLPWYNPVLYPLQFLNLLVLIVFYTLKFRIVPGVNWKGRIVK